MQLLFEIGQLAVALAVSGAVANLIGTVYIAVGALVLATCMALLYDAARQRGEITEEPITFWSLAHMAGTSIVFGLIWPSIPLIFTWRRVGVDEK
jgi:hypothetical protein